VIEIAITKDMVERAKDLANEMGSLRNSIRNGAGNLAGFLGEECVLSYFPQAERDNSYNHDLIAHGRRIEVKTKDRTVIPKPQYECSIAQYNTRQETDYYFFISLLREGTEYVRGFLLGYMPKAEYFDKATLLKKGDYDPSNNFIVKADCYNLRIGDLRPFHKP
jgi:hypothetical protein